MVEPGTRVSVHHCGKCSPIALTHLNPPYPDNFNYFKTVDIFKKKIGHFVKTLMTSWTIYVCYVLSFEDETSWHEHTITSYQLLLVASQSIYP